MTRPAVRTRTWTFQPLVNSDAVTIAQLVTQLHAAGRNAQNIAAVLWQAHKTAKGYISVYTAPSEGQSSDDRNAEKRANS